MMCGKLVTVSNEKGDNNAQDQAGLLTPEEREVCARIAAGNPPHSQRALALLALDQGATQVEAGERSGLTKGSVRYWRNLFRKRRLSIFSEALLGKEEPGSSLTPPKTPQQQAHQPEVIESPHPTQPVVGEQVEKVGETPQQVGAVEGEKRAKGRAAVEGGRKPKKKRKEKTMAKKTKKAKGGKRQTKAKGGKKAKKRKKTAKKAKGGKGRAGADVGKRRKKKQ
jgi:hypothetical protein